ncbi:ethanolamine permease [Collinsella bouchesdurhonensis]|uniref:ethanolamine permease n=1 Tax=Collinsella bouchesdurhonensis TaxID=1907654 RepID=UPI00096A6F26|nr:ethanolamine permease [Collinsella bouchesdurhonensis]
MEKDISQSRNEDAEYFDKRSLKAGSVNWILLIGLGVSYVISGDFSGWNYGIAKGGWLGLAIAFAAMGLMYLCTVFGLAELSSAMPTAGAGYGFARSALGRMGGFATGLALTIEYVCAPAAISTFIVNYIVSLGIAPDVPPLVMVIIVYAVFTALHIIGVGEALKLMFVITAIALSALLVFLFGTAGSFHLGKLFDISPIASFGASRALPMGVSGVLACLPYGIWFFLGVEGTPLASEEAENPKVDVPRGLIGSMFILVVSGLLVLFLAAGTVGAATIGASDTPLIDALVLLDHPALATYVNWAGLAGLIASYFSLMFAGSRQIFALSRAGYFPTCLSVTGKRKTPVSALLVLSVVGIVIVAIMGDGSLILNVAVFGACISYALLNLSHIILRKKAADMKRGYRTPGGTLTTAIGFCLSVVAVISTFFVDVVAAGSVLCIYVLGLLYYMLFARNRIVGNAPEEELAALISAEQELR